MHTLQWWAKNAHDQQRAVGDLGIGGAQPSRCSSDFDISHPLAALLSRRPRVDTPVPTWWSTQKGMAPQWTATPDHLLLSWQLCSGFAHGRAWANIVGLDAKVVREVSPESARCSSPTRWSGRYRPWRAVSGREGL
jgi:hypothetical protein